MKTLFYIGEVARLLGLSPQTLRYYERIGLLRPSVVNQKNGYRQFAYDQIHYIERIRYLQNLGLSLKDIRSGLVSGNIDDLVACLERRKETIHGKIQELQEVAESIKWYIEYYRHMEKNDFPEIPFKRYFPQIYLLAAPLEEGESIYGSAGYRLTEEMSKKNFRSVLFLRQNGYILNFSALKQKKIQPLAYYIFLKKRPPFDHPFIREVPEGEYLCFRGRILTGEFSLDCVEKYLSRFKSSPLILANEYEDNFEEFLKCNYEIQILIRKGSPSTLAPTMDS